jgi:hypothetical protein
MRKLPGRCVMRKWVPALLLFAGVLLGFGSQLPAESPSGPTAEKPKSELVEQTSRTLAQLDVTPQIKSPGCSAWVSRKPRPAC